MEKVTGFLFQLIGAASRNPACNLPHNPHKLYDLRSGR